LMTLALAVAITVLGAWILAVLVERPCLRWGRRWSEAILKRQNEAAKAAPAQEQASMRPAETRWRRWYRTAGRVR
jgi:peptidoglycan/LPS O-acetylase OafA/YrhL